MKHNPVAKYAHMFNVCKVINTHRGDNSPVFMIAAFNTEGQFIESEVFESLKEAQLFEKELVNHGYVVTMSIL